MAITGREFGKAMCDHFGLPTSQVLSQIKVNTDANEILSVTLTIALTPDDLAGIAKRMKESGEPIIPQPANTR